MKDPYFPADLDAYKRRCQDRVTVAWRPSADDRDDLLRAVPSVVDRLLQLESENANLLIKTAGFRKLLGDAFRALCSAKPILQPRSIYTKTLVSDSIAAISKALSGETPV